MLQANQQNNWRGGGINKVDACDRLPITSSIEVYNVNTIYDEATRPMIMVIDPRQ